jgi:WD40 repeat protein/energy-coupling factor transporter ATP-binding protein EcfA2
MNSASVSPTPNKIENSFPSLAALRAVHGDLLKQYRQDQENGLPLTAQRLSDIEAFVRRGQATGALLDSEDDRWAAQSLLDYWIAILYRAGFEPPEATLADFDLSLAPELDDSLCPYRGLDAFREKDRQFFYGRQRLLDQLLQKLQENQFLAVVGSSGSGKSSVVLGGLIPSLKAGKLPGSENWHYYVSMMPGSNPLANLARLFCFEDLEERGSIEKQIEQQAGQLLQNSNRLTQLLSQADGQPSVLVIDQFEEVFTLCQDRDIRQAFINNLVALVQGPEPSRCHMILTMRSDFENQVVKLPNFQPIFEAAEVRVLPLDASELREAIEKPAERVGLKFEDGLVDQLINDVLGEPSALPLLQFTLLKLWKDRERNRITQEAYKRLGGGRLALSNSADEFYNKLIPEEQVTCKRIFLRMVRPTEGLEVTSSRIPIKELYRAGEAGDRVERVLNKLIEARLVRQTEGNTPNDTQVEVAHEALIRNWRQLVEWLEDARVNLRQRLRLKAAAAQWEEKGRDQGALLRGALLEEARQYDDLTELETQFFSRSIEYEKNRKSEKNKLRNRITIVSTIAALFSIIFTLFSVYQLQQLERQRVKLLGTNAEALVESQPVKAVISAIAARGLSQSNFVQLPDRPQDLVDGRLLDIFQVDNLEENKLDHEAAVNSVLYSPDGKRIVSGSQDKTVRIWDATTGKPIGNPLLGHKAAVLSVSYSPDGKRIVSSSGEILSIITGSVSTSSGSQDNTVRIWDASTGEPIGKPLLGHTAAVFSVSYSPDGKRIVSGSQDKTVRIWDANTGALLRILQGHAAAVLSVSYSPDSKHIVSGSRDKTVRIWDATTGKPIGKPLLGHTAAVNSVSYSPDGKRIVSGSQDKTVRIWDANTGALLRILQGHAAAVLSVSFSLDGLRIVSGSQDNTVRIWDANTGAPIGKPLNHEGPVKSVSYSRPDGKRIVSGSQDKTVRIWDASTGKPISKPLLGHKAAVLSVSYSPDGKRIVSSSGEILSIITSSVSTSSSSQDNTVRIWDATTGKPISKPLLGHKAAVFSVSYSPDSRRIVSGSWDKTVRIWDASTGKPIGNPLLGHTDWVNSVSYSPDGKRIVSGSQDNTVRVWDASTGKPIGNPLLGHTAAVNRVSYSPDGRRIVSSSDDYELRIWDASTGKPIGKPLQGHTAAVNSVSYSPDSRRIVSGSNDNTVRIWDASTGEPIGKPLLGHTAQVWSVSFSLDGRRIVSGSWDKTVRIWDANTGEPIGKPLLDHTAEVWSVSFSLDGKKIISGSQDRTVRVWDIENIDNSWEHLLPIACNQLRYHPSLNHPPIDLVEVAREAKQTCEQYVWKH